MAEARDYLGKSGKAEREDMGHNTKNRGRAEEPSERPENHVLKAERPVKGKVSRRGEKAKRQEGLGHGHKVIYVIRSSFSFILSIMGRHWRRAEK